MSIPITLYDENHERVGETYHRRAKQLLKSGRGYWLKEGHSMMLTPYPGPPVKEIRMDSVYTNNGMAPEGPPAAAASNDLLMYLAKQNVAQKKTLVRHIIAYILALPLFHIVFYRFVPQYVTAYAQAPPGQMIIRNVREWPQYFIMPWHANDFVVADVGVSYNVVMAHQQAATSIAGHNNLWYFVLGIMAAWGIWIAALGIKIAYRHLKNRAPRPAKPDPVAMEYQRLRSMAAEGNA